MDEAPRNGIGRHRILALECLMELPPIARRFASTSVVRTAYSIVVPSGESCGSDTAFIAAKSSNLMGRRDCASAVDANASGAAAASASEVLTIVMYRPLYGACGPAVRLYQSSFPVSRLGPPASASRMSASTSFDSRGAREIHSRPWSVMR